MAEEQNKKIEFLMDVAKHTLSASAGAFAGDGYRENQHDLELRLGEVMNKEMNWRQGRVRDIDDQYDGIENYAAWIQAVSTNLPTLLDRLGLLLEIIAKGARKFSENSENQKLTYEKFVQIISDLSLRFVIK
ncbi:MAG: hypothetical protein M3367_03105 [Acidobacteriota bacterium]|nr:hypothetical protein [Acidobacteriota bacterium]